MVNRDQVAGIAKQMKGSVKQAAGKATGNRRTEVEGAADKLAGKVQKGLWRREGQGQEGVLTSQAP